jgi:hypothetical protein
MHMQCPASPQQSPTSDAFTPYPLLQPFAVPCLSRASDLEKYDPKSEFALGGDEEGWVATHQDPGSAAAGSSAAAAAAQEDDIPDLDAEEAPTAAAAGGAGRQGGAAAAAVDDDDVPDISELELVEPDDEVRLHAQRCWRVCSWGDCMGLVMPVSVRTGSQKLCTLSSASAAGD